MGSWLNRRARRVAAAAATLFCATLGLGLRGSDSASRSALVRASYDACFNGWLGTDSISGPLPVLIVYLDLDSYRREGLDPGRPWPRGLHARLLRRLTAAGARAVVFDVVFDQPGPDPAADAGLSAAIRDHGRVVLAGEWSVASGQTEGGPGGRTVRVVRPAAVFMDGAAGWGLGELGIDSDFVARRHFAGQVLNGEFRPSLTWAAARALGLEAVAAGPESGAGRWMRYYGPPLALPHVSYSQALEPGALPDGIFRDRIVFVGARPMAGSLMERRDELRSPHRSWGERDLFTPGVEVHATQMLNLLRGDWLRRPSPAVEVTGLMLAAAVFGAGLVRLPASAAALAALGGCVGAWGAARFALGHGCWFPWQIVAFAQIPGALAASWLHQFREWYVTRRRLEAERRAADARIREQAALIDKANDAIVVRDLSGRALLVNPAAERLYGWSLEELRAQVGPAIELDPVKVAAAHATVMERGEWSGELVQRRRNGTPVTVESRWTLIRDEAGTPRSLLTISTDVTEKKQLAAEAHRLQRMEAVGALASGMAHDLNNALAPVLMGTQLLRRDAPGEEERRILGLMEASAQRGADMVRQVLAFAREGRGGRELLDLRPMVRELEKLARETFPKAITVRAHVPDDLWPVQANATELHQVLLNLCVNARDAMPSGGSLDLVADNTTLNGEEAGRIPGAQAGQFVTLLVSDSGTGIAPEVLSRLFEPFFTTKPEGRGTGLGLSTTARIVRAHGGYVTVQSRVGEGTTFEVGLPRWTGETSRETRVREEVPAMGRGEGILVADDDEAVREIFGRTLEEHGYRVWSVANGAEAVTHCRRHRDEVSLVISDVQMPVLDGIQAAAEMQRIHPGLRVILLSGADQALPETPGQGSDHRIFLSKPVELTDLLRAVANALGR